MKIHNIFTIFFLLNISTTSYCAEEKHDVKNNLKNHLIAGCLLATYSSIEIYSAYISSNPFDCICSSCIAGCCCCKLMILSANTYEMYHKHNYPKKSALENIPAQIIIHQTPEHREQKVATYSTPYKLA